MQNHSGRCVALVRIETTVNPARQFVFVLIMVVATCATTALTVYFGMRGNPWVGLAPIMVSIIGGLTLRITMEYGEPSGIFDPRTQSWAFLFGDSLFLPFALWAASQSWVWLGRREGQWYQTWWWLCVALAAGIAAMVVFHFILDAPDYVRAGHADLLLSPTKQWHDFVTYPSLAAALVYLGIPAIKEDFWGNGKWALGGALVWLLLGVVGDGMIHHVDPAKLHPRVQDTWLGNH